jgi:hypothetical protein
VIEVALPAYMTCEEPNCKAKQAVSLFLCMEGGFAFKPPSGDWQVVVSRGGGPFATRCPQHKAEAKLIQPSPIIPGLEREH